MSLCAVPSFSLAVSDGHHRRSPSTGPPHPLRDWRCGCAIACPSERGRPQTAQTRRRGGPRRGGRGNVDDKLTNRCGSCYLPAKTQRAANRKGRIRLWEGGGFTSGPKKKGESRIRRSGSSADANALVTGCCPLSFSDRLRFSLKFSPAPVTRYTAGPAARSRNASLESKATAGRYQWPTNPTRIRGHGFALSLSLSLPSFLSIAPALSCFSFPSSSPLLESSHSPLLWVRRS